MKGVTVNLVRGQELRLHPADAKAEEALKAFAPGELVPVRVVKERNPRFHRKFFAMLDVAFQNQEQYSNAEGFRAAVTVAAGHYTLYTPAGGGEPVKYPKSIAWDKMDDIEFGKLYRDALDVICNDFLPGTDPEAFQEALDQVSSFG